MKVRLREISAEFEDGLAGLDTPSINFVPFLRGLEEVHRQVTNNC